MVLPLISIIVPCYNQAQYLDEALQSVANQTYENWECIIVNDGSTDDTEETAKVWIEKDNRFSYLILENGGLSNARNSGIAKAIGEFILPLDADDRIATNYIASAIDAFKKDNTLKVVYCKAEKFGAETGIWNLPEFSLYNLAQKNMIFCSALFRKKEWELVGGYDPGMIYGWEDWEFWIAVLKNGGNVKCLDEVGFYYRIKSKSMLNQVNHDHSVYLQEYVSVKHADFFVKTFGSFAFLNIQRDALKKEYEAKLKSEKFIINLFCKTFFGFKIFKK
ncbi:glycosyltransferase family 2 protein [Pseudomonas shirazensis]